MVFLDKPCLGTSLERIASVKQCVCRRCEGKQHSWLLEDVRIVAREVVGNSIAK